MNEKICMLVLDQKRFYLTIKNSQERLSRKEIVELFETIFDVIKEHRIKIDKDTKENMLGYIQDN